MQRSCWPVAAARAGLHADLRHHTARAKLRAGAAAAAFAVLDSRNVSGAFDDGAFMMLPGVDLSFTARRPLSRTAVWAGEFVASLVDGLRFFTYAYYASNQSRPRQHTDRVNHGYNSLLTRS